MVFSRAQVMEFEEVIMNVLKKDSFTATLIDIVSSSIKDIIKQEMKDVIGFYQAKITELEENIKTLESDNKKLHDKTNARQDTFDQQLRRKNIRIFGIKEEKNECTEDVVIKTLSKKLNIDIPSDSIDECYRVGGVKEGKNKRHILIKFTTFKIKNMIYKNKSNLKGSNLVIKEDLTPYRLNELKMLSDKHGTRNVWSMNGEIYFKYEKSIKKHI